MIRASFRTQPGPHSDTSSYANERKPTKKRTNGKQRDRFGSNSNAINLNSDHLTRPDINYLSDDLTISFWLKTTTNDSNIRTIIDDKSPPTPNNPNTYISGLVIFLQDGKVGISCTHERSPIGYPLTWRSFSFLTNTDISDGEWHHIVVTYDGGTT